MTNEISFGLGAYKDKKDRRDFRVCTVQTPVSLPGSFRIEEKFAPNNQFSRGSCTSQAQSHHKERQEDTELSARFIMALTKKWEGNTDYGAYTRNCFRIVQKYGACKQELYPEPDAVMPWLEYVDHTRIPQECFSDAVNHTAKTYWRVENNVDAIKQALYQNKNSVVISMAWYREFNRPYSTGILPSPVNYVGGHAVDVVGYDDKDQVLIIKNSWGDTWGDRGYFKLPYLMVSSVVWDCWISLDYEKIMPVDKYYGHKRTWADYLLEKKIAFNPWLYNKIKRLPSNREIIALRFYWEFEAVFKAKYGDLWLRFSKPEAIKQNLLKDFN